MKTQRIIWIVAFFLILLSIFQSCKRIDKKEAKTSKPKVETAQKAAKSAMSKEINRAKARNNYDQMIVGKWKDTNSLMEYRADGVFIGEWKEGTTAGQWAIFGDTLQMKFPLDGNIPEYKIIEFTENHFKIKSLEDGTVFGKDRIE